MRFYAVRTRIVKTGGNIVEVILESLERQNLQLENGDILALASKIVACAEGCTAKLISRDECIFMNAFGCS